MGTTVAEAFEAVQKALDEACDPKNLTKAEYQELLQDLDADIAGRLEAVEHELAEAADASL
jgi:hypothetical protein